MQPDVLESAPENSPRERGNVYKRIALLGSTGSIGVNVLDVTSSMRDRAEITSLAANRNADLLARQIRDVKPRRAVIRDESLLADLKSKTGAVETEIEAGESALLDLARDPEIDTVFNSISGAAGLPVSLAAIESGNTLALANKESLVMAGSILMPLARKNGVEIIPVDSEHSAIMQALGGADKRVIKRVIITASGGALFESTPSELARITVAEVLNHPTWNMGRRITVDSATLLNKALEIIEARWLFDLEPSQIEVLIHRQSIVHSIVEFADNSMIAQLGVPDMRLPIQYALTYPDRIRGNAARLELAEVASLTFEQPDSERFPALALGYRVLEAGGTSGAVLNAADETAVAVFLEGDIPFTDIIPLVEKTLNEHEPIPEPTIEQILAADRWARDEVKKCFKQ